MLPGPLVSVMMPVYNAEAFLEISIASILNQTHKDLELIIINDGSNDNSKKIIESFTDSRIKYYENPVNSGIVITRNRAIDLSMGKYIAFLDSDDIAYPDRIKLQFEFLENNTDYGMCGSFYEIIDEAEKLIGRNRLPESDSEIKAHLVLNNCFCNSSVMVRRELLNGLRYDKAYEMAEDYFLWYRISKITKVRNLPVFTTRYRVHGSNISIKKSAVMIRCRKAIDMAILDDLQIKYSQDQLDLHSNFILGNYAYFSDGKKLTELESWLKDFYIQISKKGTYDLKTIIRIFSLRWISLLFEKKRFSKKIFVSSLTDISFLNYLKNMLEFFRLKLLGTYKVF